jgi:hypothetical protein
MIQFCSVNLRTTPFAFAGLVLAGCASCSHLGGGNSTYNDTSRWNAMSWTPCYAADESTVRSGTDCPPYGFFNQSTRNRSGTYAYRDGRAGSMDSNNANRSNMGSDSQGGNMSGIKSEAE